jgi:hypothetical protein
MVPNHSRCAWSKVLLCCLAPVVLAAACPAQTADPWPAAARNVAHAVESRASSPSAISLAVKNDSSLTPAEVERIHSLLLSDFSAAGMAVVRPERALADVRVTLSEGISGFVCVVEIEHSSQREVAIFAVARPKEPAAANPASAITLRKTMLWSQPGPMLDAAALDAGRSLLVLDASAISLYRSQDSRWQLQQTQPIAHERAWPRDLRGLVRARPDGKFDAYLPGERCSGEIEPTLTAACRPSDDPWPLGSDADSARGFFGARNFFTGALAGVAGVSSVVPFYSAAPVPGQDTQIWLAATDGTLRSASGRAAGVPSGSDIATIKSGCGTAGWQLLLSGSGDSTQSDTLRAADFSSGAPVLVGAPLEFDGPITALWTADDGVSAVAIVRNASGGADEDYEAFSISVACR